MTPQAWIELSILVLCIILAATASATETALTSVGRLRVRHLVEEGSRQASVLHRLQQDPNRFLSTVLVLNTVALIVASSSATLLGVDYLPRSWSFAGDVLVSIGLSFVLLVFAEVTPKTLAIRRPERVALVMAAPVDLLARVLRPVLWLINIFPRVLTGGRATHGPFVTEQELMTILSVSEEQGVIEEEEREMIHGIIEIGDKLVREVMVPRTDVIAVDKTAGVEDITALIRDHGHTRLPVFEEDLDHIVGLVHAKDILMLYARGESFSLEEIARPIRFAPEQKKVDELLHDMQQLKVHMMVVVDEYGGTAGLVTLEDLLEEIVGEIRDEYDVAEEERLQFIDEHEALVDARFSMEELNDRLQLQIPESEEYDSVGGYVYSMLGTIPESGATFEGGRAHWTVESVNGRRILFVRLHSEEPWPREELVEAGLQPAQTETNSRNGQDGGNTTAREAIS